MTDCHQLVSAQVKRLKSKASIQKNHCLNVGSNFERAKDELQERKRKKHALFPDSMKTEILPAIGGEGGRDGRLG